MFTNVDATTMRRLNRATVLGIIKEKRTTSRIDIAQITGLNKATVSYIVDELIAEEYVQEVGYGTSSGGRKPVLLKFNANVAYAIGVDVQITHMTTTVCNTRGDLVYRESVRIPYTDVAQTAQIESTLIEQISLAMKAAPKSPLGVVGIGVALPATVNFHSGEIYYLSSLQVTSWNLRETLHTHFRIPVFLDNDANCGAWCEYQRRNGATRNLVYINAGIGVGAGIIIEGKLYRGRDGLAGEYGHTTISALGFACVCGNYGCWEEYASERSLVRYIKEAGGQMPAPDPESHATLVDQVMYEAHLDNRAYIRAFHSLGQYLGVGIANVTNALNPDLISLGGTLSRAATFILPEIERVLQHRAIGRNKTMSVTIATLHCVAIGAAGIAIDETLFASIQETVTP